MKKLVVSIFLISVGFTSTLSASDTVKFTNPKARGVALDWCKSWAHGCGKPAADYFCKVRGYLRATTFAKENNLGYTRILKTGRICNANFCDSFKYIRCQKRPIVRFKRFKHPKYQGIALDWCYKWASNCGRTVANKYCHLLGFPKGALRFAKENNVGYTKIMRTGQICNARGCDSFRYIDCKR